MRIESLKHQVDHRVAVVRCESYGDVHDALARGIKLLGGLGKFCSPGEKILLKPNILVGDHPDRGTTTHPAVFEAVAEMFVSAGAAFRYGDSPGFGPPQVAVRTSGFSEIADRLGGELADFNTAVQTPNPGGKLIKQFNLAKGVVDSDGVINLPKFKTHGLTRLTGAVKNLYGCLPGHQKAGYHAAIPEKEHFAEMLVDLGGLISPRLHIMDGILGMEGNGPRNGNMRQVGVILISVNPHALDYCAARIMNLAPQLVPTLKVAEERGLYHPDEVQILGDPLDEFILEDYDVNRSPSENDGSQRFYMNLLRDWVTPRPVINPELCSRCGRCITVCPVTPKALGRSDGNGSLPEYEYSNCIRCYCCQEMCPDAAITIKTPFLGRVADKLRI